MSETVVKDFKVKHGLVVADGGTFGGTVTVATPTELFHAATKAYVDANAGGNASIQVSDVAPSNPETGNAWFDSTTGRFYIYFDLTWVEIGGSGGGSGGGGNFTLSETAPEDPVAGDTWFNTTIAILYVYYDDFWVEVSAGKAGPTGPMFLDYQGAWSNTIGYNENDGVSYNGSLWRLDQPTSAPGTIPSTPDWQLVVQKGDKGDTGELSIGTVTTVVNGTPATVTNSGTTTDAILDFEIPAGPRSTIEIGTVTTVTNGTPATVTNSGDESDAVFDFEIPAGPRSTIEIGTVTTGDYSSQVTVTNSGTSSDAIFDISIPQGIPGDFVVSETPPENPLEGHVWYDSTRAKAYIYYDSFWVEYAPGFVGPQGPAGQDAVLNILGEYNNFYDYQIDDVVTYNGSLYIRTGEPNTGYAPTDTNYWTLIVEGGADGAAGDPGRFYASDTAPVNPSTGDGWFDTASTKFFIFYDSFWVEVGTSQQGEPGAPGQDGAPGEPGVVAANAPLAYDAQTQTLSIDLSNYATTQAVADAIAALVDSAPSTLDTLNELAAALADDSSFATTITNSLSNKQDIIVPVSVSSNISLSSGKYFVDTSVSRTLTLPAVPTLGYEIQIFDASGTAGTNTITIMNNGQKINGVLDSAILDINGVAATFTYTGSTYGWRMG